MNVKCPLSIAFIGLALTSSAFSWKSKPTAELKADFVRFAREAGHGAFADKIASDIRSMSTTTVPRRRRRSARRSWEPPAGPTSACSAK